jgi:hypothetical protein
MLMMMTATGRQAVRMYSVVWIDKKSSILDCQSSASHVAEAVDDHPESCY